MTEPAQLPELLPYSLVDRWNELSEEQQGHVIGFLAERRTTTFREALDFEERTRPDDD